MKTIKNRCWIVLASACCLAWSLTRAGAATASVTVDPASTLTTGTSTWTKTEWETDGNSESWTMVNVSGTSVSGGSIRGTTSSTTPQLSRASITGGPDLDLGFNDFLDLRIQLPVNYSGNIVIYYGVTGHGIKSGDNRNGTDLTLTGFSASRMVTIPNAVIAKDGGFHVYRIDMGLEEYWRGTLTDLRIVPATVVGTAFAIDHVLVGDEPGNDYLTRVSNLCPANGTVTHVDAGNTNATIISKESKRFRIIYSNLTYTEDPGAPWTDAKALATLRNLEESWQNHVKRLRYNDPGYPQGQSSGTKYKINMTMTFLGGTWSGTEDDAPLKRGYFAWQNTYPAGTRDNPPSWVNPHEFMHVCQAHTRKGIHDSTMGKWWESHANYGAETMFDIYPDIFEANASQLSQGYMMSSFKYPSHPNHWYDNWPLWLYMDQNPDVLPGMTGDKSFSSRIWTENLDYEYIFSTIDRLVKAGGGSGVKDVIGSYARRNAIWDYGTRKTAMQSHISSFWDADTNTLYRYPALRQRPDDSTWWQIAPELAPQAFAHNIHDLKPNTEGTNGRVVSVNFQGLPNADRQADWRASFIVVNDSGVARYSPLFNSGTNSVTLAANENKVYLSVAATPGEILGTMFEDTIQSYKSDPAKTRFPYQMQIGGANFREVGGGSTTGLVQHANGGGWKASTATVASTAYVGPNARVLGTAVVSGTARIEDYAVVKESATVKDNAIVSGHAIVRQSSLVQGYARVREYALVQGSATVEGNARVGGHRIMADSCKATDNATLKGAGTSFSNYVFSGDVIFDGDSLGNVSVSNGALSGWIWDDQAAAYAVSHANPPALFACYDFAASHPYAALDKYGVTDGQLAGAPVWAASDGVRSGVMSFNGSGQYVLLSRWLSDFRESTITAWVKWNGGAANQAIFHFGDGTTASQIYVTPSNAAGKCELKIKKGATTVSIPAASALPVGTWTFVSVVLDGVTASLYLDGALAGSAACALRPEDVLPADTNETPAHNFLAHGAGLADFNGAIDDFKVYSTAIPGGVGVRVAALSTTLQENGNTASFRISRVALDPASLQQPLTVTYTIGGTASSGTDYVRPSGTVTIPANAAYADVAITSVPDAATETSETITLTVNGGSGYEVVSAAATASINLLDRGPDMATFSSSLLAWYKFAETSGTTAADSSSKGNTGTLYNGPVWNTGESALTFDGVDDYVQTPVVAASTRTLSAWIRPDTSSFRGAIFDCDTPGQYGTGWGASYGSIYVILDNEFWNTGVLLTPNVWQHVTLTFDATQARIYVNGALQASHSYTQGSVTAVNYKIGRSNANAEFFDGDIRQAMIYNRAVTDTEALSIYNGQLTTPSAAPTNLTGTAGAGSVQLSWSAAGTGETMYYIGRSTTPGGPYVYVGQVPAGTTSFTDTGLSSSTQYYYVVVGAANGGTGPASSQVAVTPYPEPGNGIWTSGTAGNWSLPTNWQGNVVGGGTDKTATFSMATGVTVTLDSARTIGSLNFATSNYTLTGGTLTLDVTTGTPVVSVGTGVSATIALVLAGSDGVAKSGPGTLTLTGQNSFNGGLTINGGTVEAARSMQDYGIHTLGTGPITINNGGTLRSTAQWSTSSEWNGTTVGAVTINQGGTWSIQGVGQTIRNGLYLNGGSITATVSNTDWGALHLKSGVTAGDGVTSTASSIAADTALDGGKIITVNSGSQLNYSGVIHNQWGTTGSITKSGSGTLVLSANNSYSGGTTVATNGGVLEISGQSGGTGGIRGAVTVNTGGELRATGGGGAVFGYTAGQKIDTFNIIGGTVNTSVGSNHIWAATVNMAGGTLKLDSNASNSPTGTYYEWGNTPVNTLASPESSTISGRIRIRADANPTLTFTVADGTAATDLLVNAAITESGVSGISKAGFGTMVLSGIYSYTGTTTVSDGTLMVTGSTAGSSAVTVANGATLGGTGKVGGIITVQSGGTLAPGASVGTLTSGSSVTLNGHLAIEVNGTGCDRLSVAGNFNITNATLDLSVLSGGIAQQEYVIASFGSLTGTQFAGITGLPAGYKVAYDLTNKVIKLTPSFTSWAAGCGLSDSTPNGDPDKDGLPNALEYVLGGNPSQPNSGIAPTTSLVGNNIVFAFQRTDASETADITLRVEASTDLFNWNEIYLVGAATASPSGGVVIQENDSAPDTVTVTIPKGTGSAKFVRLRAVVTP